MQDISTWFFLIQLDLWSYATLPVCEKLPRLPLTRSVETGTRLLLTQHAARETGAADPFVALLWIFDSFICLYKDQLESISVCMKIENKQIKPTYCETLSLRASINAKGSVLYGWRYFTYETDPKLILVMPVFSDHPQGQPLPKGQNISDRTIPFLWPSRSLDLMFGTVLQSLWNWQIRTFML